MQYDGKIRFATYEAQPTYLQIPKKTLRDDLPKRIQRFAVWLGDKIGIFKQDFEIKTSYQVHQIDLRGTLEEIMKHKANVEMLTAKRAKYLIVGRDIMQRIGMQDAVLRHLGRHEFPFATQIPERLPGEPATISRTLYGLEVVLVPYIDGCFVLPDLDK